MIGNTKSSILSLALWTENPPNHNITSILYLEKSNIIITGSDNGHIIVWSNKMVDSQFVPLNYIISHHSKIISLCLAGSRKHTDIDYFVSFSKDREIGLWEAGNARSIEFLTNASFDINTISSFESENLKQRLLFCCLTSPEIVVINSMSLSELCTLICTNNINIFSSVTTFISSTKDDIVLGCTESGLISIWSLNFSDANIEPQFNPKFKATRSIMINITNPITISHNPYQSFVTLILSACKFMIYNVNNCHVLCYQNSHRGDHFTGGQFVNINSVLLHYRSGKSVFYKLPPRSDYGDPEFGQISTDMCDNIPRLLYQFKEPENLNMLRHSVTTKLSEDGFVIWKGFVDGTICKWHFNASTIKMDPQIFSLSKSWSKMITKPSNLANRLEEPSICGPVTSLLFLTDLSLFVLGMHSGAIFVTNFENSVGSVFIKTPPKNTDFIKLIGHTGPVLCLIHPCSTMKLPSRITSANNPRLKPCLHLLKLTHILWSGGEDFTLRIWNIKTQQCLNVFNCHSAPIIMMRLNHLPENGGNICGFSQGITAAMFNSVADDDTNSADIRQLISICMNSFMIAISEDDGISIISVMKRKLLLYSIEHDSSVKRLGWLLDSGYLLLETITDTVYVWDLSSRSLDRIESGETAHALMDNFCLITKLRSQSLQNSINNSDMIRRHSLSSDNCNYCSPFNVTSEKVIKFQFIKTGDSKSFVPVLIFDLTKLLDSLDDSVHTPTDFYSLLCEMDNQIFREFRNSDGISDFDTLMMDVTKVNRHMDLKTSIIKIILSQTKLQHKSSPLDAAIYRFLDSKSDLVSCSFGQVNSKTGSIIFNLKDQFIESEESVSTIESILLQLSISNKIINSSNRNRKDSSIGPRVSIDMPCSLSWPRKHSSSNISLNFTDYFSSTKLSKLLLAYRKSILDRNVPMLLKKTRKNGRFSEISDNLLFSVMERMFNSLITGILDGCDWINTSAYEIIVELINNLSAQDIQYYLLTTRLILLPNLDHYTTEDGRNFSARINTYLHRFSEPSFMISDWIWWYSPAGIKVDHDQKNLTKIQIRSLAYLALIGTYLQSDDSTKSMEDTKLFSRIFSLDNFFLARVTCDFLLNLLTIDCSTVKKTKNRLVSLALLCLSEGFKVWEPFINSSVLICKMFELTEEEEFGEEGNALIISALARQSLRYIAVVRPSLFITVCHQELLRLQNTNHNSIVNSHSLNTSMKNSHSGKTVSDINNSHDNGSYKKPCGSMIFKNDVLYPILSELCDRRPEIISELLSEAVELFLNCHERSRDGVDVELLHLLNPVVKFTSVSIHASSGHISVGSSNGLLVLFEYKTGKYFAQAAHLKSITYSLFSNDAKHLATYSVEEGMVKIWQISHSGLFHTGSALYHVKLVLSQMVPAIYDMLRLRDVKLLTDSLDSSMKEKKKERKGRSLHKHRHKDGRPTSVISDDTGVGLYWDTDNRSLSINYKGLVLQSFKV